MKHIKSVEKGKEFIFRDGKHASNIKELVDVIKQLSEEEFSHYVTYYKNDFANWIRDVLGNKELAAKVYLETSKQGVIDVLEHYLQAPHSKTGKKVETKIAHKGLIHKEGHGKHIVESHYKLEQHLSKFTYSELVKKFLLQEFLMGFLYGVVITLILLGILKALQVI